MLSNQNPILLNREVTKISSAQQMFEWILESSMNLLRSSTRWSSTSANYSPQAPTQKRTISVQGSIGFFYNQRASDLGKVTSPEGGWAPVFVGREPRCSKFHPVRFSCTSILACLVSYPSKQRDDCCARFSK